MQLSGLHHLLCTYEFCDWLPIRGWMVPQGHTLLAVFLFHGRCFCTGTVVVFRRKCNSFVQSGVRPSLPSLFHFLSPPLCCPAAFHELFEEHVVMYNFPESLVSQYFLWRSLVSSLGDQASGLAMYCKVATCKNFFVT